jgi:L-ornithine N5-oxygenase
MVSQEQIYDTLSVGFGPASVALAIALVEHNAGLPSPHDGPAVYSALGGLQDALGYDAQAAAAATTASDGRPASPSSPASQPSKQVKACFIERYDGFKWHPGMMLPGSKMQIS